MFSFEGWRFLLLLAHKSIAIFDQKKIYKKFSAVFFFFCFWSSKPWIRIRIVSGSGLYPDPDSHEMLDPGTLLCSANEGYRTCLGEIFVLKRECPARLDQPLYLCFILFFFLFFWNGFLGFKQKFLFTFFTLCAQADHFSDKLIFKMREPYILYPDRSWLALNLSCLFYEIEVCQKDFHTNRSSKYSGIREIFLYSIKRFVVKIN